MGSILVLAEHSEGVIAAATYEALAAARVLNPDDLTVLVCGEVENPDSLGHHGADRVIVAEHELLADFGPETWSQVLADIITDREPDIVVVAGTSKGNEVMAQAAARLDVPFVANCLDVGDEASDMTRVQWGGSLLEEVELDADVRLLSINHHHVEGAIVGDDDAEVETIEVDINPSLARTVVVRREMAEAGVTLATAPVVVGGGRATGSPEGFAPLEELAALLDGRVGCSRAVTNNGWRPHSDQVGQTGTRIAPQLYIASGISGAIQHWVGAAASKNILAINTDREANMVTRANYAVIGDMHEVIPAIVAEVKRRRSQNPA